MSKIFRPGLLAVLLAACIPLSPAADNPPADPAARLAEVQKLVAELKPQTGEVTLADGVAKVVLPAQLRYLSSKDAETVLTKIWGNPRGDRSLGMLVPANFDPLTEESWAVIISFEEDGYVKDDDAAKIDYTKLLADMKESVAESSKQRQAQGYPPIALVGWATPPRYDSAAKKLYWAKELKFGDSPENTLNYNIRILGRRGVLVLNAVAEMKQLKQIENVTPLLLGAVNFQEGHRYADFKEDSDKVAAYGITALVAGGVAAKAGFFKALWLGILAFKKFIIIGLIALAAVGKKIWNSVRDRKAAAATAAATPAGGPPPPAA